MAQTTSDAATPRQVDEDEAIEMFRLMATARTLEIHLAKAYAEDKLPGWIHSCEGHEAFGAALGLCMSATDHLVPHYRSRPEQLSKGMSVRQVVAEVFATTHAASKGRGGETHVSSVEHRVYGMTGVLGSNIPLAVGVAYASKMRGLDEVTVCTFGDGTANRGAFHEALNLAAIWDLPVVFVCENNVYAEMSRTSDFLRVENIADRAGAYGIPGVIVDGHDPEAVVAVMSAAIEQARDGRPTLVEAKMIRRRGHWEGDPQAYRPKEELADLDRRDPVAGYRATLVARGLADEKLAMLESAAEIEVADAIEWAVTSPRLTAAQATAGVYSDEVLDG